MLERTVESSDAELVEAALKGDVNSFGELYRRHYAAAVGIAQGALSDRHLAEDAAQEAFAIACRDLGRLRRADRFASWLGAISRKVARRSARSRLRPQNEQPADKRIADAANGEDERGAAVRQAVQRLPRSAREVILLRYFSRLSHEQIATTLGISRQAVHGRLIRAKRKLADDLRPNGLWRKKA